MTPFSTSWAQTWRAANDDPPVYPLWNAELERPFATARIGLVKSIPKERYFDARRLRLMDRAMTLASVTAGLALEDAALFDGNDVAGRDQVATILASAHGEIPSILRFGLPVYKQSGSANPAHFPTLARNIACGQVALRFGLRGWSTMLASGEASGAQALARAVEMVALGRAEVAVVGAYEVLAQVSLHLIKTRWHQNGLCTTLEQCESNHHVPVEGACFMVLESASHAARRGRTPYATISHTTQGYRSRSAASGWDAIVTRHAQRGRPAGSTGLHVRGRSPHSPASAPETALAREFGKLHARAAEFDARAIFGDAGAVTAVYQTAFAAQWLRERRQRDAALVSALSPSGAYTLISMHASPDEPVMPS